VGFWWVFLFLPGIAQIDMSYELALSHLREQYDGRMVLYCRDLAEILGRSELSVSHLLDRGHLPFKVKKVGRERCVDIFQVAQWLTAGAEEENPPNKPTNQSRTPGKGNKPAREVTAQLTPMMAEILQMRHDAPMAMARFAAQLEDLDERCFMVEVAQKLLFSRDALRSQFVVTMQFQKAVVGGLSRAEEKIYFDRFADADTCVRNLQATSDLDGSIRIRMKWGHKVLQHFSSVDGTWLNLL
jgi:hypothetical protein